MPKIDILLATYNSEKYLPTLIDSLVAQTYSDWRILVHDDGSTDETVAILEKYSRNLSGKLVFLRSGISFRNPALSFSHLAQKAECPYIMFCDHDDVWLPDKISLTLEKMLAVERVSPAGTPVLIYTDLKVVGPSLEPICGSLWKYQNFTPGKDSFGSLLVQNIITGCTVMVNSSLLRIALPVPSEAIMHDWWVALVAAAFGRIAHVPVPTILYRQHANNYGGAKQWGIQYILSKLSDVLDRRNLLDGMHRVVSQAAVFYVRYEDKLPVDKRGAVSACSKLFEYNWLMRRLVLIRYGLFRAGIIRNLALIVRI